MIPGIGPIDLAKQIKISEIEVLTCDLQKVLCTLNCHTPMNCHIIEPSTMSHGDWQSWEVFMTIMVIIMSHNHIKLFHCFADARLVSRLLVR